VEIPNIDGLSFANLNFDGDPQSDTIFPATMLVDYVRVFEKK
jgi:hypothetical protein